MNTEIQYLKGQRRYIARKARQLRKSPFQAGDTAMVTVYNEIADRLSSTHVKLDLLDSFRDDDYLATGAKLITYLIQWADSGNRLSAYGGIVKVDSLESLYTAYSDTLSDVALTTTGELVSRLQDADREAEDRIKKLTVAE